jgi:hypothetical protein
MRDETARVPSVAQVRGLAAALERFIHADEATSYPAAYWRQEDHRLDGFIGLAAALRPLRELTAVRGWPEWVQPWLLDVLKATAGTFDLVTRSWGWGPLTRPGPGRDAFIRQRCVAFERRHLEPIRDVARECSKRLTAVECPPEVARLAAAVPPVDTPPWFPGLDYDARLAPLRDALRAKDKACRLGSRFPSLDPNDPDPDPKAIAAASVLRGALVQLRAAVASAPPEPVDLVAALRKDKPLSHTMIKVLEFMQGKDDAPMDKFAASVHGDPHATPDAVRKNLGRVNHWLEKKAVGTHFLLKDGRVVRDRPPG